MLFGGVAAGLPEATIGGAVTLAIGIGIQNFPRESPYPFLYAGLEQVDGRAFTMAN